MTEFAEQAEELERLAKELNDPGVEVKISEKLTEQQRDLDNELEKHFETLRKVAAG